MSNKRARLDEDGRRVRQLELELELARLRRRDDEDAREGPSSGVGEAAPAQDPAPPASQPGTSSASTAAVNPPTPAPSSTATTPAGSQPLVRVLQTVFVCVACDKIYCQQCNA